MSNTTLPEVVAAKWIWKKSLLGREDSFLFARQSFSLAQSGVPADFWISANHGYQLLINGRFVGRGPSSAPDGCSYADYYDLSYYLDTGVNVIAILAHHTAGETYAHSAKVPGLWCQLNINGVPTVCSGSDWKVLSGDCYHYARPRRGKNLELVEVCNLQQYPWGWSLGNYFDLGWTFCDYTVKAEEFPSRLIPNPLEAPEFEELNDNWSFVAQGTHDPTAMLTQIHFEQFATKPGVYGARTYLFADPAGQESVKLYCDKPCRLLVNGTQIILHEPAAECNYSSWTLDLQQGWNELLLFQQTDTASMGAMLAFTQRLKGGLDLYSAPDERAEKGWRIFGPFRKPFSELTASLDPALAPLGCSLAAKNIITDAQAYLDSSEMTVEKTDFGEARQVSLQRYEFVVFDLGLLQYGFPGLSLEGKAGDIVDITYGETLNDLKIPRNHDHTRSVDTLILRAGSNRWLKFSAACCRYVMVSTRRCTDTVTVNGLWIVHYARNFRKNTLFRCADEEINQIWEISRYLSLLSAKSTFIGIPFYRRTQYLSDACIQARNSYYISNDYSLSRKALLEYARAQFEDGSIPRSISGIPEANHIDQMMMYPLWVQDYFRYSGNDQFLTEILPHIDRLIRYLDGLTDRRSGLLEEFPEWNNIQFFRKEEIDKHGMVTALNALYCRALFAAADLHLNHGDKDRAEALQQQASRIAARVRKLTYDEDLQCFADSFHDGKRSTGYSIYTNVLALYSGIALPEDAEAIFVRFFSNSDWAETLTLGKIGILFRLFLLDTLYAYGQSRLALEYLRFCHREFAKDKTMTPGLAIDRTLPTTAFLIQEVAGIRLATPGFSTVYFCPAADLVKGVKMALPTAHGRIKVDWKVDDKGNLEAKIDANYPLNVVPQLPPELMEKTTLLLGKQVIVLDPDSRKA